MNKCLFKYSVCVCAFEVIWHSLRDSQNFHVYNFLLLSKILYTLCKCAYVLSPKCCGNVSHRRHGGISYSRQRSVKFCVGNEIKFGMKLCDLHFNFELIMYFIFIYWMFYTNSVYYCNWNITNQVRIQNFFFSECADPEDIYKLSLILKIVL